MMFNMTELDKLGGDTPYDVFTVFVITCGDGVRVFRQEDRRVWLFRWLSDPWFVLV